MKKITTLFLALLASTGLSMVAADETSGLYDVQFSLSQEKISFQLEFSSNVYYVGIYMNIDGNAETGWKSYWWDPSGVDYLIENSWVEDWWSNLTAYIGEGNDHTEWKWEDTFIATDAQSVTTTLGNGHIALNGSISRSVFSKPITNLEVGVLVSDSEWNKIGIWPAESAPMFQVQGSSTRIENPTNLGDTHKCLRDGQIVILRGDKTYTVTGQEMK